MEQNQQQNNQPPPGQFVKTTSLKMSDGTRHYFSLVTDGQGGWTVREDQRKAFTELLLAKQRDSGSLSERKYRMYLDRLNSSGGPNGTMPESGSSPFP